MVHLTSGQVRAEAVARVVQTEEGELWTVRYEARGQQVKTPGVVQPAVESQPSGAWLWGGRGPELGSQDSPGYRNCHLSTDSTHHSLHHHPNCCHSAPVYREYTQITDDTSIELNIQKS